MSDSCSVMSDSTTPQTGVCQAPRSMEFSRQEYWSGLPFPPSGDLPDPGIEPTSLGSLPALAGGFFTNNATWKAHIYTLLCIKLITNKNLLYNTGNST